MPPFMKTKTFIGGVIAVALVGLYAIAGFLVAPKLIRNALLEDIPKSIDATPAVGPIHVNPFLMQVAIDDFSLADPSGAKLLGFRRFFIDFQLSSLWNRAYTFVAIDLTAPFVNAIVAKDGQMNLLRLKPKASPQPDDKSKKEGAIPAVRIKDFRVTQGLVSYDDASRASDFAARLEPIDFELQDFTTGVDGGRFNLTGASKLGEKFEWHGHVSVQPLESDGEFQIDGLQVHTIWSYLADQLNFLVNSGKLDLNATYRFSLQDTTQLNVDVAKVSLTDLKVAPRGTAGDWITLPELQVSDARIDLGKRQAQVDSVKVSGLGIDAWREPDGSISLAQLVAKQGAAAAPAPTPENAAWTYSVREVALENADIKVEDRSVSPAAKVEIAPLNVKLNEISGDMSKPVPLVVAAKINAKGALDVDGEITPQPLAANLKVKLDNFDLAVAQPYIAQRTSMTLRSGELGTTAEVHYGTGKPAIRFTGDLNISHLHTVDDALHEDFINWERLDIKGLTYEQGPDRLDINEIIARKAYARVIIEPDTSVNVKRVLTAPHAATSPATATASPPAGKAPAGTPAMPITVKKVQLIDSQTNFADLSIKPNFATGIQGLGGTVLGLSSMPGTRAKVDLKGAVDKFSPVTIKGEINALSTVLYTDMGMSFQNIELSTFNPYSGKFAGYNIAKGKLTTDLHYKVDGRKLDAQHHIKVDQLEFGDKTGSKDAVSLPIKLAVALLKDRNGVIDLDLPVTGSLDDPKFRLGPIIWKVFVNILEKAVTAPFALIGSLFGGGPDLQFVDFEPGRPTLDPAGTDKAHIIAKALDARPQLKIEVPIAVVADLDRPNLIEQRFQQKIREARESDAGGKNAAKKTQATLPFEQLEPTAQLDVLTKIAKQETRFPDEIAGIKLKADQVNAKVAFLTKEIQSHIAVDDDELNALGQQRAQNLQAAVLAEGNIAPERVFLVASDKAINDNGKVRLELSLQ